VDVIPIAVPMGRVPVYLRIHEWLIFMVNVGRYASPMDSMGYDVSLFVQVDR